MNSFLIVAGEMSGDRLGSGLVEEFRRLMPEACFFGVGGDRLAQQGVELIFHNGRLGVLGFAEALRSYPLLLRVRRKILKAVDTRRPILAILIDYPGFNLSLAQELKKRGIRVFYYVSPQIWAWGKSRLRKIARRVDLMAVIFDFEKKIYEQFGIPVVWVGHPMVDELAPYIANEYTESDPSPTADDVPLLGVFPGSRAQEVRLIFPEVLRAVEIIRKKQPLLKAFVARAPTVGQGLLDQIASKFGVRIPSYDGPAFGLMRRARLNIICSGTATLECGLLGRPMIVVYKASFLTYQIARRLIRIPHISLVNIVAGKKIVPELIQHDCCGPKIAAEVRRLLDDRSAYERTRAELIALRAQLGQPGASRRAALAAYELATQNQQSKT